MLGENKIISGNHMDGSFKIHTIGGHLLHSVFGHTGVVSCVASFNNYVFTGSKDSSLVSWQYSIGKVLFTRRFLGHTSSLVQISSIAAHYLLCSLNSNGDILIHDFRTGECLQGIKSSFTGICTSPIKLIAGYNSRETQIMDLQGRTVWKKTGHMKMVRFDTTGENLCFSKDFSWGFWNLFDEHKKFEKKEERAVMEIQIATGQNYLVHTEKDGKYSFVYSFQIVNKDRLVVNPPSFSL
jgi:WD40 repeat protein